MRSSTHKRARGRRAAFTLLEVLMVIVILGILAAVIVPQFMGTGERARIDLTRTQIKSLDSQLETFRLHCGRFPTSDEGLAALLNKPSDETLAEKWGGPYLKEVPKDGWGRELQFESPGRFNETTYDLSSPGPNGQPGDDDDIANWTKS